MTNFETFEAVVLVFQFLATLLIAFVLARQAEKLKRSEISGHVLNAMNHLNSIALANPENLRTFDAFGRPNADDTDETRRRRWCAFVWLVVLQEMFISKKDGMLDGDHANRSLRQQLDIILKDDLVFWLVHNRGFDPDFVAYCVKIRQEVAPGRIYYEESEAVAGLTKSETSTS